MAGSEQSLTGVWDGVFSYPRLFQPTAFTAVLFQTGIAISGTTHEVNTQGPSAGEALNAMIEGGRFGSAVRFTKIYETISVRRRSPVIYDGVLNADATEIEGTWMIPGNWSGKFLMVRAGRNAVAAETRERVSAPAR